MRQISSDNGIRLKAYPGTTGVLLAMDLERKPEKDFLGFAIERMGTGGQWEWLNGLLPFPHMEVSPGQPIPSNVAPIQKFRWTLSLCRSLSVHPDERLSARFRRRFAPKEMASNVPSAMTETATIVKPVNKLCTFCRSHRPM